MAHLGVVPEYAEAGKSRISLVIQPEFENSFQIAHGGVVMTLLDFAMGAAARSTVNQQLGAMTIDMNVSFLRPSVGKIVVEGSVLKFGKTIHYCEAIVLNEAGAIDHLVGEQGTYQSDFYIDSTGFSKMLISKLGAKWQSYSEYLKMKSAIVFPIGDTEEYNMWTVAQAMDYGWMFKIPVWGRSGNGYIFDSDYITPEQAKEEVEKFLGHEITVGKTLHFDPGALDRVWIKNCCAIGLSSSFVEPLEATSIGTSIQQTFLLMHRLPNYDQATIDKYNKDISDILTNLRDFIILHYITKKDNTQFWKDVRQLPIPESLAENLKKWKKNLPIADDFKGSTDYKLFSEAHHIHILAGLKLFDTELIKQEYDMMHPAIKQRAETFIRETRTLEKTQPTVGHKEFIAHIRST